LDYGRRKYHLKGPALTKLQLEINQERKDKIRSSTQKKQEEMMRRVKQKKR